MLIEDDPRLAEYLTLSLRDRGFEVSHVPDAEHLKLKLAAPESTDVVILDRLLGSYDTKNSLLEIRGKWPKAPVLVLSAISTPNERTDLLNQGADDYLSKPFATQELVARLQALMRRTSGYTPDCTQVGDLTINAVKRTMNTARASENLTAKEFLVLKTLAQHPGRVWSRADLLDSVWGISPLVDTNVVEATVTNLRKKIGEIGSNTSIKNARNAGYWIEA